MSLLAASPSNPTGNSRNHWEARRATASGTLACEALNAEIREPLDPLLSTAIDEMTGPILVALDRAIDARDLALALTLERLLPMSLGAEPAIVDRFVTLRLWEGDLGPASAGLGACPVATPRLNLLRAVVRVRSGFSETASFSRENGLILRVLQTLISHTTQSRPMGPAHHAGDATVAVCALVTGRACPVATLTLALVHLERLLESDGTLATGTLTTAVLASLRGVALDLGITLGSTPPADELAVTPTDRARLRLRAA